MREDVILGERLKRAVGVEGNFKEAILPMIGYNSASILFGGAGYIISLYFLSFLTEVEGLQPKQAGLVILFAQIWDGVNDPIMGIITDRTRSRYGKHRRYFLWGIVPVAISYFMLWNSFGISGAGNPTRTMVYYIVTYLLFNTASTIVAVPHTAMLPELAPKYFLRTQYKSVEYIMNSVGMISSFLLVSLTFGFTNMENFNPALRQRFMVIGLILCLWFSLPLIFTFKYTAEPSSLDLKLPPLDVRFVIDEYLQVFRNKAFRRYFYLSLFYMMCRGFYSSSSQYFYRYVAQKFNYYNVINSVAGVAEASGFPLNFWLTKKYGKQFCGKLLAPVMLAGILANLLIKPSTPLAMIFIAVILYFFGYSGVGFVGTNTQPDVTDVDEMITGRRREGVIATFSALIKNTVSGLMNAATGLILSDFGFVTGKGTVTQTARGLFGLKITFVFLPVLFLVLTVFSIYHYRMTKQDHEMIKAAIAEKKEKGYVTLTDEQKQRCEEIAGHPFEDMWIGKQNEKEMNAVNILMD